MTLISAIGTNHSENECSRTVKRMNSGVKLHKFKTQLHKYYLYDLGFTWNFLCFIFKTGWWKNLPSTIVVRINALITLSTGLRAWHIQHHVSVSFIFSVIPSMWFLTCASVLHFDKGIIIPCGNFFHSRALKSWSLLYTFIHIEFVIISSHCFYFYLRLYLEFMHHILSCVGQAFLDRERNNCPLPNFPILLSSILILHIVYFLDLHELDYLPLDLFPFANILKHPSNICNLMSKDMPTGELANGQWDRHK